MIIRHLLMLRNKAEITVLGNKIQWLTGYRILTTVSDGKRSHVTYGEVYLEALGHPLSEHLFYSNTAF